jgi:hypothetical protein
MLPGTTTRESWSWWLLYSLWNPKGEAQRLRLSKDSVATNLGLRSNVGPSRGAIKLGRRKSERRESIEKERYCS